MNKKRSLLKHLADGSFHSGQSLANNLAVSRTAIWKYVRSLLNDGIEIYSVRGKGYCLAHTLELLDKNNILEHIDLQVRSSVKKIEVLFETKSTNQYLIDKLTGGRIHGSVILAEYQSAGRGRRGNNWVSPLASGLCMSFGWHFDAPPASLTALSLASGVAINNALQTAGVHSTRLKWPNDLVYKGCKLGGILLESKTETASSCDVVLGVGINVNIPLSTVTSIGQPVTDVSHICEYPPSRNRLAGILISEIIKMFTEYADTGFSSYIDRWRELDNSAGKPAVLDMGNRKISGNVIGIDDSGLLLMAINGQIKSFSSGELSLRLKN